MALAFFIFKKGFSINVFEIMERANANAIIQKPSMIVMSLGLEPE